MKHTVTKLVFLIPLFLTSCFLRNNQNAQTVPVIRDAHGNNFLVSCLQEKGPDNMGECRVENQSYGLTNARGSHSGGSSQSVQNSRYYYWNLLSFQERFICQYLFGRWGVYYCYALFGYPSPPTNPPDDGWCNPWFNDGDVTGWPEHCGWEPPDAFTGRLLEIRLEEIVILDTDDDGNQTRPESSSLYINEGGMLYRENCPESLMGPAVLPIACELQFIRRFSRRTLQQIQYYLDRVRGGLEDASPPINCFAVATHLKTFKGRNGSIELREVPISCGTTLENQSHAGQVLLDFMDRIEDYYGLNN